MSNKKYFWAITLIALFVLYFLGLLMYRNFIGCVPEGKHGNYFQKDNCCYGLKTGYIGSQPQPKDGGFDCVK